MHRLFYAAGLFLFVLPVPTAVFGQQGLGKVNHIIILMQENHSFDNYFGVLAYAPGSPYHNGNGRCASTDHKCVDGLSCSPGSGGLNCTNSNVEDDGSAVSAFKAASRCSDDPDHSWL